jgi:hypothetical protein
MCFNVRLLAAPFAHKNEEFSTGASYAQPRAANEAYMLGVFAFVFDPPFQSCTNCSGTTMIRVRPGIVAFDVVSVAFPDS